MGTRQRPPDPSLLVVAAFSRHLTALNWAQDRLEECFGPLECVSPDFDFHHTEYYAATMGTGLKKRFLVFSQLRPADILASAKNLTIGLENELALRGSFPEVRPINLDPGLLQLGKLILASTKDQSHRIYLQDGVYAEVTLKFEAKRFECWPWTYADYREPALRQFLEDVRARLYALIHSGQKA
jgi:uncharacterized protein DUF4416